MSSATQRPQQDEIQEPAQAEEIPWTDEDEAASDAAWDAFAAETGDELTDSDEWVLNHAPTGRLVN